MESGNKTRKGAFAGSFYPSEKKELEEQLKSFFKKTKTVSKNIKALIIPHAGYIYSGQVAAWGFAQFPKKTPKPHFVLIGPSHFYSFTKLAVSKKEFWQTPIGTVKHLIPKKFGGGVIVSDSIHLPEHCLEVELPFLQFLYKNASVTCFLTGQKVDVSEACEYLAANFPSSYFIVSSDLSHYLPEEIARKKDQRTIEAILSLNEDYFLREENAACGAEGILILMELAKREGWRGELVKYDNSATTSGDNSTVVGYGTIAFK